MQTEWACQADKMKTGHLASETWYDHVIFSYLHPPKNLSISRLWLDNLFSAQTNMWKQRWRKSGKPSTGRTCFITMYRTKYLDSELQTDDLTFHTGLFQLSLLCFTIDFRLKVNVGRRYWTSTGPKQRNWRSNLLQSDAVTFIVTLYNSVVSNLLFIHSRKVEQSLEEGVSLSSGLVAQSSQYPLIQSKPDYRRLCRQLPLLQEVEIIVSSIFDRCWYN